MHTPNLELLLVNIMDAALQAGEAILEVYAGEHYAEQKADGSPITLADKRSNTIITNILQQTPYPIISEESPIPEYEIRKDWEYYWLVDPLDGTKEFVIQNGEFTINIALVRRGKPILGLISAPVLQMAYFGIENQGAYKISNLGSLKATSLNYAKLMEKARKLDSRVRHRSLDIAISRSHFEPKTKEIVNKLIASGLEVELISRGSSLKFGLLAENIVNLYPRIGTTMEWDTAAGHAILLAAGGAVLHLGHDHQISYNKEDLRSPSFVAFLDPKLFGDLRSQFAL